MAAAPFGVKARSVGGGGGSLRNRAEAPGPTPEPVRCPGEDADPWMRLPQAVAAAYSALTLFQFTTDQNAFR